MARADSADPTPYHRVSHFASCGDSHKDSCNYVKILSSRANLQDIKKFEGTTGRLHEQRSRENQGSKRKENKKYFTIIISTTAGYS
ncbi:hypothetical protein AB6A40_009165 [Gnathostoma spinigerum]|uniref:Uncharacterized protein n=1 Tax=Gnathostoma spinigerum TaxID=75299 RepID=A0ABD6ET11_9BILA